MSDALPAQPQLSVDNSWSKTMLVQAVMPQRPYTISSTAAVVPTLSSSAPLAGFLSPLRILWPLSLERLVYSSCRTAWHLPGLGYCRYPATILDTAAALEQQTQPTGDASALNAQAVRGSSHSAVVE